MSLPPSLPGIPTPTGRLGQLTQAVLAIGIVGATVALYGTGRQVPPELLVLASAVIATYFAGYANRQVNGAKVDALTAAVQAYHATVLTQGASSQASVTTTAPATGASSDPLAAAP